MKVVTEQNFNDLPFEENLSNDVKKSLYKILSEEKQITSKDPLISSKEFMSSQCKISSFMNHSKLLDKSYGEVEPLKLFRLNKDIIDSLSNYLSMQNITKINESKNVNNKFLYITEFANPEKTKKINDNIEFYDLKMDKFLNDFHKHLKNFLSDYIKSPFSFVNTRAWITKPGSSRFGANAPHHDGFHHGHMKLMIYLTPLSKEYGEFWIENKTLTNQEKGTCIIFRNSDYLHSGVPGTKYPRVSMEITIMRSFVNCPQFHEGNINGRHYLDINTPYKYFL